MNDSNKNAASEVLTFWFGSDLPDHPPAETLRKCWFSGGSPFDDEIRTRFGDLVDAALAGQLGDWRETLSGQLALVLVCDQFTRNIFRGSPRAFAGDPQALAISQAVIRDNQQTTLGLHQRAFLGMPLEHSEQPEVQAQSVAYFDQLRQDFTSGPEAKTAASYYRFAARHRDVIAEFGRYPHRNAALGRPSTAAEQAWLDAGGGF
ncbi:DUF924 family protein [uncultured Microbulbifer sp.]|uniref:DUF924 family protein n=1 Tax=uncultured Microbulbifer sp. TaxID=348147 RepID=UPI0025EADEED|nr:DUF924 family protein [uncultured Microbulbifer sp.]